MSRGKLFSSKNDSEIKVIRKTFSKFIIIYENTIDYDAIFSAFENDKNRDFDGDEEDVEYIEYSEEYDLVRNDIREKIQPRLPQHRTPDDALKYQIDNVQDMEYDDEDP